MKSFNRLASACAFTGVLLAAASVIAAPAELVAQTTVPSQRPANPGQQRFEAGLDAYSLDVETGINWAVTQANFSSNAPACIASCLPWVNLNQRF